MRVILKAYWSLILAIFVAPAGTLQAGSADARLYCTSLKFARGYDDNNEYYLELTTLPVGVNGELVRNFGATYSHFSYLELTDDWYGVTDQGALAVNTPNADADGDGFPDYLEVAQAVNASTSGQYQFNGLGSGTIQASWARAAGERTGNCVLKFKPSASYTWITISCTFDVLEYSGDLTYSNSGGDISAILNLRQTGLPDNLLGGPLDLVRSAANRFNELDFSATDWTNGFEQVLSIEEGALMRFSKWPTNYSGYIDFTDGEPNTVDEDYQTWILSVDDLADADHDGIPDLSDDATVVPPERPAVAIQVAGGMVQFAVRGTVNHRHLLQEATAVDATTWTTVQTVTLASSPQTLTLPVPEGPRFWRVVAE